ncbi:MAG TPA: hypothetical protein VF591_16225 [Pyrinomonadaceae bacterium]|jgi:hypothetical protein
MKVTPSARANLLSGWVAPFLAAAVLAASLSECRPLFSNAKGKTSDIKCEPGMGVVNNEPDAGVNVKVTVTNVGEAGFIKVSPELSTSEGEWSRGQSLQFGKGESKSLTYFFHEPTVNIFAGSAVQCRVGVSPSAD